MQLSRLGTSARKAAAACSTGPLGTGRGSEVTHMQNSFAPEGSEIRNKYIYEVLSGLIEQAKMRPPRNIADHFNAGPPYSTVRRCSELFLRLLKYI